MKIAVVGIGYVGLSNAILLAQHNQVIALDVALEKVTMLNNRKTTFADLEIKEFLENKELDLCATLDKEIAYINADFIIVSTPTDYDPRTNHFNTKSIELVIQDIIKINPNALVVIKSTISLLISGTPVAYCYIEDMELPLLQLTLIKQLQLKFLWHNHVHQRLTPTYIPQLLESHRTFH